MNGQLLICDCKLRMKGWKRGRDSDLLVLQEDNPLARLANRPTMEWWQLFLNAYDRDIARRMVTVRHHEFPFHSGIEALSIVDEQVVGIFDSKQKPKSLHRHQSSTKTAAYLKVHDPEGLKRLMANSHSEEARIKKQESMKKYWKDQPPEKHYYHCLQSRLGRNPYKTKLQWEFYRDNPDILKAFLDHRIQRLREAFAARKLAKQQAGWVKRRPYSYSRLRKNMRSREYQARKRKEKESSLCQEAIFTT